MNSDKRSFYSVLVIGAPLLLAILECFHPHPHDLLKLDLQRWLLVHYLQIPLFPLTALAVATLVRGRAGIATCVCRVAIFVFGVTYVAFDTAAGVVTGILSRAANASPDPESWRRAIDVVSNHPIMGGGSVPGPPPLLAILGSIALSVGAVAAGFSLKRSGNSWLPLILLAISSFGIAVFKTHA